MLSEQSYIKSSLTAFWQLTTHSLGRSGECNHINSLVDVCGDVRVLKHPRRRAPTRHTKPRVSTQKNQSIIFQEDLDMLHSKVKIIDKGVFNTVPCLKTPPYNFTFSHPTSVSRVALRRIATLAPWHTLRATTSHFLSCRHIMYLLRLKNCLGGSGVWGEQPHNKTTAAFQ